MTDWKTKLTELKRGMKGSSWALLLIAGVVLMLCSFPGPGKKETAKTENAPEETARSGSYERELEMRIKRLLESAEGVGEVDVMVVLASDGERVLRVDRTRTVNDTEEKDSAGGVRTQSQSQWEENTVLSQGSDAGGPLVEKELRPEITGVLISAQGGGSPVIRAEIVHAMEAVLGISANRIHVLQKQ